MKTKQILRVCLLMAAVFMIMPRPAISQSPFMGEIVLFGGHWTGEAAELLIGLRKKPGADTDMVRGIRVAFIFKVSSASGALLGEVPVEVPIDGFATIQFTIGDPDSTTGMAPLFANGEPVGDVAVDDDGRVSYRIDGRRSIMGFDPATGAEVPIPPNVGVSVTTTLIDADGQTLGRVRGQWQNTTHLGGVF